VSDDLAAFLHARYDEVEAWAKAASAPYPYANEGATTPPGGVHWEWVTGDRWEPVALDPAVDEFVADGAPVWLASRETWASGSQPQWQLRATASEPIQEMRTGHAGHIARHDPARVLRDVEAKRRILDLHARREDNVAERLGFTAPDMCELCGETWPCRTVCLLALPFADHPGYHEEWKP
jgi:hypothetical protein